LSSSLPSKKGIIDFKYEEDILLEEIFSYIIKTYTQHYSKDKYQATEFIIDAGHGKGFCIGNVLKYAQRYGKKGSHEDHKKDLLKIIHYAIIALFIHNKEGNQDD
jgi:hypothetical protein